MLITSDQVLTRITMREAIAAVDHAFQALAAGRVGAPVSLGLEVPSGTFHVKACAAHAPGKGGLFVAKVNANFPGNPAAGLPTIQGIIAVFDADSGKVLAVVDSPSVTSLRTAATTALVVQCLGAVGATMATIVGCGALGRFHVEALQACGFVRVTVFDSEPARADALAAWACDKLGLACEAVEEVRRATRASQVVVTCTSSRVPFLGIEDVQPGTLIAAVGADNERKSEIEPALLRTSRIVTDLTTQCLKIGDLRNAPDVRVCGELVDVVAGRVARTNTNEIVIFDSTGLAVEDLALCELLVDLAASPAIATAP